MGGFPGLQKFNYVGQTFGHFLTAYPFFSVKSYVKPQAIMQLESCVWGRSGALPYLNPHPVPSRSL